MSYLNKLCESKLPKKIEARRDAADVIIAGINPSDIWDGTLGGALKPAIAPFKALFYAAIGNIFGAASSVLEIRNQITSHQENGDSTNRKASPEVMETQFIQLFYDLTFIDRKTILLEYRPAIEYCTSMTPLSVNLRGRIKKSRDII